MPRPPSGDPLWKPVAFKLPEPDILALRRYADVHRVSISEVLREGMALRLGQNGAPNELYRHTLTATAEAGEETLVADDHQPDLASTALAEIRDSLARLEAQVEALTQAVVSQSASQDYTVIPESRPVAVEPLTLLDRMRTAAMALGDFTIKQMCTAVGNDNSNGQVTTNLTQMVERGEVEKQGARKKAIYTMRPSRVAAGADRPS